MQLILLYHVGHSQFKAFLGEIKVNMVILLVKSDYHRGLKASILYYLLIWIVTIYKLLYIEGTISRSCLMRKPHGLSQCQWYIFHLLSTKNVNEHAPES
jgi:hypothetical protein